MRIISGVAEDLVVSQEGLFSIELGSWLVSIEKLKNFLWLHSIAPIFTT
jgi:hypothetical protein